MELPWRSTVLPTASRTQPSLTQYSSTLLRSMPLNLIPTPRSSSSALWKGLEGLVESRSGSAGLSFSTFVIEASFKRPCFLGPKDPLPQVPYDVAVETCAIPPSIPPAGSHMRLTHNL